MLSIVLFLKAVDDGASLEGKLSCIMTNIRMGLYLFDGHFKDQLYCISVVPGFFNVCITFLK